MTGVRCSLLTNKKRIKRKAKKDVGGKSFNDTKCLTASQPKSEMSPAAKPAHVGAAGRCNFLRCTPCQCAEDEEKKKVE